MKKARRTDKYSSLRKTIVSLAKDPRVQRAVMTLVPVVVGLLKSRKKSKKR